MPGSLPLIGCGEALDLIERTARVDLPVWIWGEAGTEKDFVAFAIHAASAREAGPFVPVRCGSLAGRRPHPEEIVRQFRQAAGGTIFLQDVDALSAPFQRQLLGLLADGSGEAGDFRVLSSSTEDLPDLACAGRFSRPLVEALCCLAVVVPPLRERSGDIEIMIRYFAARQAAGTRPFSDELIAFLRAYPWPGNVSEFIRIVRRLTVLSDVETLTLDDLRRYAPELAPHRARPTAPPKAGFPTAWEMPPTASGYRWDLADRLLQGDFTLFPDLHSGVQKAVTYLVGHYQGPVSLGAAARHACLTPSHLSVLFHRSLGCTFRDLLSALRLQKAKQLLAAQPRLSVTEVSFEAGFSELGTFERCFKRAMGCGPREYRSRAAHGRSPGISGSSPSSSPSASRKPSP